MAKPKYHLHLKGYVGGWDFDSDYVDYILSKYPGEHVDVLIDSTGGYVGTALSVAAAFRRHGDVSVHFVGLNASAATIASLGAKHISIDKAAMYLVHKCSTTFFKWASLNSDQYSELIKDIQKTKEDLDKFDLNAARQYAARCKRKPEEMLSLMAKGGWLTAQEALDWGFVDEITDLEADHNSLQVTDSLVEAMAASGLPIPENFNISDDNSRSTLSKLLNRLLSPFKGEKTKEPTPEVIKESETATDITNSQDNSIQDTVMKKTFALLCALLVVEALEFKDKKTELTEDQLQAIEDALASKNSEIENLKKQNAELQTKLEDKPADTSSQVVEDSKGEKTEKTDLENYIDDWNESRKIYDMLP